jgi:hypothetical protein
MLYYNRVLQDEDKTGMDELNMAKRRLINARSIKQRISNDDYRISTLMSSNYKNSVDPKTVEENVKEIKVLYNKNIDLMIKLKNTFTPDMGGAPGPIPAGVIPVAPPPPVAALIPAAPAPPAIIPPPPPPPPPPPAVAPPAPYVAPPPPPAVAPPIAPLPAPAVPHIFSGIGHYLGLYGPAAPAPPPAGSGAGLKRTRTRKGGNMKGGVLKIVEKYGIGADMVNYIDLIQRNNDLIKERMYLLFPTVNYLSFKSFNELISLHNKFYLMFDPNIVPYHISQVSVPLVMSLTTIDFMEILDRLTTLFVVYANEFARNLIPRLITSYNTMERGM